jgi:aldehyde dehydrogenase (NAD+)
MLRAEHRPAGRADDRRCPISVLRRIQACTRTGHRLVTHPLVKKVSFTGGLATATKILTACAEAAKPVVLELGGKSANIVLEDADLQAACAFNTAVAFGGLAGQGCGLPTRMILQESIHDEVVDKVRTLVNAIQAGDPSDPATAYAVIDTPGAANDAAAERAGVATAIGELWAPSPRAAYR